MHKMGGTGFTPRNWRRRWFVLKDGKLYYYKTSFVSGGRERGKERGREGGRWKSEGGRESGKEGGREGGRWKSVREGV